MGRLQILPGNLADMIAAGEVVTRPASVIKELMENSLDAGATSISVIVTDAGRTMMRVIDNGCGMSADDAVLAFERHATSKIASVEDLDAISTFGFRGEALASICAVSEVTLKTRREEDELGTQVDVKASVVEDVCEVQSPCGCNFAVRNLFYNIPARRKFLKSDKYELKNIVEEFIRIALTRPDVAFSLTSDGRDLYVLKPAQSLKFRISDIAGAQVAQDIVDIQENTNILQIDGFIGRPESARKTQSNQYFFVNGRFFRSSYLHKAVMKAYGEFVPEGSTPSYFIFLNVDPHSLDVNVHPTKTEVKFEDDSLIFQILYACVRETLGRNSFNAGIDFDRENTVEIPAMSSSFSEFRPFSEPVAEFDPSYNPFDSVPGSASETPESENSRKPSGSGNPYLSSPRRTVDPPQDYGALFESKTLPNAQTIVIQGKYIASPSRSGIMLINIRRAWQRILYERFLDAASKGGHVSQRSLFPVQARIGVQNRLLFDDNAALLEKMGFDISPFGNDTIVVGGVPEGFSNNAEDVNRMVDDLILVLGDNHGGLEDMVNSAFAEKLALLGSTSTSEIHNSYEAQTLIDALFACSNSEFTSNGRRIISIMGLEEMDGRFK